MLGIVSFIFRVYINALLNVSSDFSIGCYIFMLTFSRAYEIVLLERTTFDRMLKIEDNFSDAHDIKFNSSKIELL